MAFDDAYGVAAAEEEYVTELAEEEEDASRKEEMLKRVERLSDEEVAALLAQHTDSISVEATNA